MPILKPDGTLRLCGDYRVTVNTVAKTESYPLPIIEKLLSSLADGKYFSKPDLSLAYLQESFKEYHKYVQRLIEIQQIAIRGVISTGNLSMGYGEKPSTGFNKGLCMH